MAPPAKRRKGDLPWWVVALVFVVLAGGSAGAYYAAIQPKNGVHLRALEADAAAKLPAGSTKEQVIDWFKANNITEYSDLTNTGGGKVGLRALVPNDSYVDQAELDISFWYDKEGKVTKSQFLRTVER